MSVVSTPNIIIVAEECTMADFDSVLGLGVGLGVVICMREGNVVV